MISVRDLVINVNRKAAGDGAVTGREVRAKAEAVAAATLDRGDDVPSAMILDFGRMSAPCGGRRLIDSQESDRRASRGLPRDSLLGLRTPESEVEEPRRRVTSRPSPPW